MTNLIEAKFNLNDHCIIIWQTSLAPKIKFRQIFDRLHLGKLILCRVLLFCSHNFFDFRQDLVQKRKSNVAIQALIN